MPSCFRVIVCRLVTRSIIGREGQTKWIDGSSFSPKQTNPRPKTKLKLVGFAAENKHPQVLESV